MWLEDMITGDYTPYVLRRPLSRGDRAPSTPIHTGEQIYLRQNFKDLIEQHAVNIIGPDPCDIGGIAELKWIAEYADLHGILMAPHGTGNGLIGLAALVQVCGDAAAELHRLRVPDGRSRPGGTTSSRACRTRSSRMASSRSGTGRAWASRSIAERAKRYLPEEDARLLRLNPAESRDLGNRAATWFKTMSALPRVNPGAPKLRSALPVQIGRARGKNKQQVKPEEQMSKSGTGGVFSRPLIAVHSSPRRRSRRGSEPRARRLRAGQQDRRRSHQVDTRIYQEHRRHCGVRHGRRVLQGRP